MSSIRAAAAALFIAAALSVVWVSLSGAVRPPGGGVDKLAHVAAYFGLTLSGYFAAGRRRASIAIGLVILGAALEALQHAAAGGREGSLLDAFANAAGVGAASTVPVERIVRAAERMFSKR